ncbi:P-loop ATPase, Sll1717 family [Enterococcus faecium]|uniref:P-loop ATPase, Sll1717 family n=1 Tax=Enterococcus faecium TaxID=1352 RepID=UPI0021E6F431|nr:hypothetical protein [Enterococcus faecium]MCV3178112.1 hypothetical protein [Enterococcus faecium]MCV3183152.1 hypothetical protein [Enterococcus faecium]MCV3185804.1 hypothetical protein [Enterococcus faecium]MCV3190877.1 hypothetical protein [Enterococcus faecium]MCW0079857.1 hypothetical protein [Enterococcus faecium]
MTEVSVGMFDLGAADGKKEARRPNFESLFYLEDGYYDDLTSGEKYIVVGRKGTGKSILIRYFKLQMEKSKSSYCELITIPSFMRQKLKTFNYDEIAQEEIEEFWRYVFLKELANMITSNKTNALSFLKKRNINKFEEQEYYTAQSKQIESIDELNSKLSYSDINLSSTTNSKEAIQFTPSKYYEILDDLSKLIFSYLKKTPMNYYLLFDDIDELENKISNRDQFKQICLGFLQTIESINDELYEIGNDSRIITTFRLDLLEQINSDANNLSKIIYDSSVTIEWFSPLSKEEPEQTQLAKMILHKIRNSVPDFLLLNDEELFNTVFPSGKNQNNCLEYIMLRSFGRPRDIIMFLQTYQRLYKKDTCFDYNKFGNCLRTYSKWFYTELLNEINLSEIKEDLLSSIELLKKMQLKQFSTEKFELFYRNRRL